MVWLGELEFLKTKVEKNNMRYLKNMKKTTLKSKQIHVVYEC